MRTVNPTDTPFDESPLNETPNGAPAPVPWRLGKLSIVFAGIVLIGLAINTALDSSTPSEDSGVVFDVENFPTGALGGESAPIVAFPLFDGSTFDLANHFSSDGRPVVLNFWASWCFPCRTEMPEFSDVAAANPEVLFVGVAVADDRSPAEALADEVGVVYPLGIDEQGTVAGNYPYIGLPTTFLIGSDGIVTHQIQGQVTGEALQAFIDFDFGG
jgi:thiol-disulfide isomerase/thioredoxin